MTTSIIYSQSEQDYYIVVKQNKSIEPLAKSINNNNTLSLTFDNQNLDVFFNTKVVYKYEKAFPTATTSYLQRVYIVSLIDDSYYNDLLNLNEVEHVELIEPIELLYEPNDADTSGSNSRTHLDLVHAFEAWDLTHGDENVIVGITDTYFPSHPDLVGKIVQEFDQSSSTYNHGVAVAGMIAANTDNGIGIASIGYNTKLIVSDIYGYPPTSSANEMLMISQISGVKVLNGSWHNGICQASPISEAVYDEIWNSGVVVVFTAGNGNCNGPNNYVYPASYSNTISVSSVGHVNPYGNVDPIYGRTNWRDVHEPIIGNSTTHQHNDKVDLVAPGYRIPSLKSNNTYGNYWGTSLSAPQVAATCALMFAVNPDLTSDEVRNILLSTTDDIYDIPENLPYTGRLGTGRLNVYRAVKTAKCLFDDDQNAKLDLYIRNSKKDLAVEPDTETGNVLWQSKDIWVRNQPDGKNIFEHQNPEYDPNNPSYVYVRVRNTSCITSSGNDLLKLYWTRANTTTSWPEYWDGSLSLNGSSSDNFILMGNEINTINIPILKPGQETIIEFEWQVPHPHNFTSINADPWHFDLLARIVSDDDPMSFAETENLYQNVKNNNNIAWRNTTIVDIIPDLSTKVGGIIAVGNPFNETRTFRLELVREQNELGKAIYNEAEIGVKMGDVLFNAWERGGKNSLKLKATNEEHKLIVTDNNVIIDNIQFEPNELGTLYLSFNFLTKELTEKDNFTYHVIQIDAVTNEIIGGETYEIRKKPREIFSADAGNDKEIDKNEVVTISAEEINEAAIYNWYDEDGNLIYTGKDLTVSPNVTKKYKLEIITNKDGYKDFDEIEVKVNPYSLQSLSPNPASNQVSVNYKAEGSSSAYIMITSTTNGTSNNYILNVNVFETSIDVSDYPQGIYGVALVCDGIIVDAENLIIE